MEPNTRLGSYLLEHRLGSGAMADVFMAMQPSIDRPVAIKVMHAHLAHSHDFAERFRREARAMGQLQHPNIARVIDFDATGPNPYMVIEYLPGGSLREYLDARVGPLEVAEAVAITRQLAAALHYAHGMGMVHRDIKPDNVMFVDEGRRHAVLTDFGIARLVDDSMTATGTVLGTPSYIAPEQVRGERADAAADQYSLAVMLFEMLTGERPFVADSPHALMMKHITEPVPSARDRNPAVPAALDDVVRRAMAKTPAERHPNAGAMIRALDEALAGVDSLTGQAQTLVESSPAAAPVGSAPTVAITPTAAPDSGSGNRQKIVVAAVVGLLLLAGVAFGLTQVLGDDGAADNVAATTGQPVAGESADASDADGEAGEAPAQQPAAAATESESTAGEEATQPDVTATPATAATTAPAGAGPKVPPVPSFDPADPPALFVTNAALVGDRLIVGFDHARQPSAGTTYTAWLDGVSGSAGEIVVDPTGQARLDTAMPDVTALDSFVVTEEPLGSEPTSPTGPTVLEAGLDDAARSSLVASFAALDAAERELGIAIEHDQLMRDEISAGDLAEVRRHAEHVVNILDGIEGDNFGDLDRSGLAENPGDDVGVRGHLAELGASVAGVLSESAIDTARDRAVEQVGAGQREFLRVLAADSIGEIGVDAGTVQLETTAADLARARSLLLRHVAVDLVSDVSRGSERGGIAALTRSGSELVIRSHPGGFAVVGGMRDDQTLVVQIGEGPDATVLGAPDELHSLTVAVTPERWADLAGLVVVTETSDSETADVQVIARVEAPVEAFAAVDAMLGADGSLALLEAQAQLAIDHTDLMQQQIDGGTLPELRRHAEHVVNIVEGAAGERFGDLDGDGAAQNPGDDVGVLAYLDDVRTAVEALPLDTDEQVFTTTIWLAAIDTIRAQAVGVADQAVRVLAADSLAEAEPSVAAAFASGVAMLDGTDVDDNGVIDLFAGESGVRGLPEQAPTLVVASLVAEG